jgi:translation initiation factor 3 subunit E
MSSGESASRATWDLTSQISPFLDRHMIFPLLEYLDTLIKDQDGKHLVDYNPQDVAAARLEILRPTHMVDYAIDVHQTLHPGQPVPDEMEAQKKTVYEELEALRAACGAFDKLCQDETERSKLMATGQWNFGSLNQSHQITPEMVEAYRKLARFQFECGDYQSARAMLSYYIALFAKAPLTAVDEADDDMITAGAVQQQASQNDKDLGNANMYYLTAVDESMLQVLWGRLACEVLVEDWDGANVAVDAVKTAMESLVTSRTLNALQALQQRTWLLHWSLFVYWNGNRLENLVDLCFQEKYKQAITTNAPHLLRYLTAAVLLCKRRVVNVTNKKEAQAVSPRRVLRSLIYVMQDCDYVDPIVDFVDCLCVKFDFDKAQTKLAECERVLGTDFFLCQQTDLFMEEARVFVFENYCRIHNKIDLQTLGDKLAMDQIQAERWIVDLIRNADLDAKIDSEEGCVVMGGNPQSIYEQVMDRTRDLNVRSATLAQNLNNLMNQTRKERTKKDRSSMEE